MSQRAPVNDCLSVCLFALHFLLLIAMPLPSTPQIPDYVFSPHPLPAILSFLCRLLLLLLTVRVHATVNGYLIICWRRERITSDCIVSREKRKKGAKEIFLSLCVNEKGSFFMDAWSGREDHKMRRTAPPEEKERDKKSIHTYTY